MTSSAIPANEADWEQALESLRGRLTADLVRRFGESQPEDFVQEALLRAWQYRAQFEGRSSLIQWVWRILVRLVIRHHVSEPVDLPLLLADEVLPDATDVERSALARMELAELLQTAARELTPRGAEIVHQLCDAPGARLAPRDRVALHRARRVLVNCCNDPAQDDPQ